MKKGFTLIELLVVVLIIGILAAIAVPQYQKAVEKSRAVEGLSIVKTLGDSYRRAVLATGVNPTSFAELDVDLPGTPTSTPDGEVNYISKTWRVLVYQHGVISYRNDEKVRIFYRNTDDITWCWTAPGENNSLCKSLGGKETEPATTNCGWTGNCLIITKH